MVRLFKKERMKKYKELTLSLIKPYVDKELTDIKKDIKYLKEIGKLDDFLKEFRKNNQFIYYYRFEGLNLIAKPFTSFRRVEEDIFPKNDIILHFLRNYKENDECTINSDIFLIRIAQSLTIEEKIILSKNDEFKLLFQSNINHEQHQPLDAENKSEISFDENKLH